MGRKKGNHQPNRASKNSTPKQTPTKPKPEEKAESVPEESVITSTSIEDEKIETEETIPKPTSRGFKLNLDASPTKDASVDLNQDTAQEKGKDEHEALRKEQTGLKEEKEEQEQKEEEEEEGEAEEDIEQPPPLSSPVARISLKSLSASGLSIASGAEEEDDEEDDDEEDIEQPPPLPPPTKRISQKASDGGHQINPPQEKVDSITEPVRNPVMIEAFTVPLNLNESLNLLGSPRHHEQDASPNQGTNMNFLQEYEPNVSLGLNPPTPKHPHMLGTKPRVKHDIQIVDGVPMIAALATPEIPLKGGDGESDLKAIEINTGLDLAVESEDAEIASKFDVFKESPRRAASSPLVKSPSPRPKSSTTDINSLLEMLSNEEYDDANIPAAFITRETIVSLLNLCKNLKEDKDKLTEEKDKALDIVTTLEDRLERQKKQNSALDQMLAKQSDATNFERDIKDEYEKLLAQNQITIKDLNQQNEELKIDVEKFSSLLEEKEKSIKKLKADMEQRLKESENEAKDFEKVNLSLTKENELLRKRLDMHDTVAQNRANRQVEECEQIVEEKPEEVSSSSASLVGDYPRHQMSLTPRTQAPQNAQQAAYFTPIQNDRIMASPQISHRTSPRGGRSLLEAGPGSSISGAIEEAADSFTASTHTPEEERELAKRHVEYIDYLKKLQGFLGELHQLYVEDTKAK